MTFAAFARSKRTEAGLTQQQCAEGLGMKTRGAFQRLESGERQWSLTQVEDFAHLLATTPAALLAEYEKQPR